MKKNYTIPLKSLRKILQASHMDVLREIWATTYVQYATVAILASLPVFGWMYAWFTRKDEESSHVMLVFFLGTLTVLPILGLQWVWMLHPEFDLYEIINRTVTQLFLWYVVTYVLAAVLEELVKGVVIYYIDFTTIEIKTIANCMRYNLIVALGFAFSENLLYFYTAMREESFTGFTAMFLFRSLFTVCAHMVFSSITGYYYGLAKFSDPIVEQERWQGVNHGIVRRVAHFFNRDPRAVLPIWKWWTGIFIAMTMHGTYNLCLVWGKVWVSILIVVGGFFYVRMLTKSSAGNLVLAMTGRARPSLMATRDEDVVLELLGMWMNEGKYKEVEEICNRLLERDPDNRVVKLFQAKAKDKTQLTEAFKGIQETFKKD